MLRDGIPATVMKTLTVFPENINQRHLGEAVKALNEGALIAFPTDTFYAIGCDALNNNAIERLCRLKGIDPRKEALSIVCAEISQASGFARIDNNSFRILKNNLPGAFTFILPASTSLPKVFRHRKEVGIRIPDNNVAREIARELGHPILVMTASSGEESITDPGTAELTLQSAVDVLLESGECPGQPSTVVSLADSTSPEILREGAGILS